MRIALAGLAPLILACALFTNTLHAPAARAEDDTPVPLIRVTPGLGGQAAITALGGNIDYVAARYFKTGAELRDEFLRDPALRIDRDGILYASAPPQMLDLPRWSTPQVDPRPAPGAVDKLHSKPGSPYYVYLNFQGGEVPGGFWRRSQQSAPVARPFSLGDSQSTDAMIRYVWQRVAEDFAPFDVDVTTEHNGNGRDMPDGRGTMVMITPRIDGFCSCSSAAYVDEFGNPDMPVLVFTDFLNMAREKSIAEAISNGLGRSLGLWADGVTAGDGRIPAARYGGAGLGRTGWAPIMGDGTYKELTQFSRGDYPGASNRQDDYLRLQYILNLRPDDVGNDIAKSYSLAPTLSMGRARASFDGILGIDGDADVFGLFAGEGPLTVSLGQHYRGGNTDLKLTLLDRGGAVLQTSDPRSDTAAGITASLAAGTYFLKVEGAAAAANGYGNAGAYRLVADYAPNIATAPRPAIAAGPITGVAPLSVMLNGSATSTNGRIVSYRWTFSDGQVSPFTANASNPPRVFRTFTVPGTYEARLAVTDSSGYSNFTTQKIEVLPGAEPPAHATATITYDQPPGGPFTYRFRASTGLEYWGVGTYVWNFGGEWIPVSGDRPDVVHSFPGPGSYKVQVAARDRTGNKTASGEVQIVVSQPGSSSLAAN